MSSSRSNDVLVEHIKTTCTDIMSNALVGIRGDQLKNALSSALSTFKAQGSISSFNVQDVKFVNESKPIYESHQLPQGALPGDMWIVKSDQGEKNLGLIIATDSKGNGTVLASDENVPTEREVQVTIAVHPTASLTYSLFTLSTTLSLTLD